MGYSLYSDPSCDGRHEMARLWSGAWSARWDTTFALPVAPGEDRSFTLGWKKSTPKLLQELNP